MQTQVLKGVDLQERYDETVSVTAFGKYQKGMGKTVQTHELKDVVSAERTLKRRGVNVSNRVGSASALEGTGCNGFECEQGKEHRHVTVQCGNGDCQGRVDVVDVQNGAFGCDGEKDLRNGWK